jgi:hypothetical protein
MDNEWWSGLTASVLNSCPFLNIMRVIVCSSSGMRPVHATVPVRLVLFQGDISRFQAEQSEAMKRVNLGADDIIYLVTARGHDHRIKASHILGRFVSLERISRVLPLQE